MHILVAARDVTLGAFLQREFDAEHFARRSCRGWRASEVLVEKRNYDAAILDINLRRTG